MSNSELELLNEVKQTRQSWKDKAFTSELDYRYRSLENGTDRSCSLVELQNSINKFRKKNRI